MEVSVWYLGVADVARILRLHPRTVYAAVRRGDLPHIRVGQAIKIPVEALGLTPPSPRDRRRREVQLELPFDPPLWPIRRQPLGLG